MELSDAHLLEALKLLPAAEQRSFDVCLAAEIETVQDRMRLAAVAAAAAKTEKAAAAKEKEKAAGAAKREKEKKWRQLRGLWLRRWQRRRQA